MSDCPPNEYCREQFTHVIRKIDRLDVAVRGNGKPGINVRLDRLEQWRGRQRRLAVLVVGGLSSLVGAIVAIVAPRLIGWAALILAGGL